MYIRKKDRIKLPEIESLSSTEMTEELFRCKKILIEPDRTISSEKPREKERAIKRLIEIRLHLERVF